MWMGITEVFYFGTIELNLIHSSFLKLYTISAVKNIIYKQDRKYPKLAKDTLHLHLCTCPQNPWLISVSTVLCNAHL